MKIFITGGTGFIGKNIKEKLNKIHTVYAPTSSEIDLLNEVDVSNYIKKHNFDIVIHCATWNATKTSSKDLSKVFYNNLRLFFNIVRCSSHFGRMIHLGSGAEYDRLHWQPSMSEDYFDKHVPADDYGFSKYIMAKYVEKSENITNLRLFGIFGKYEDWRIRFISNACCKAIFNLPVTINQNVYFDYLYIDDFIEIIKWFIENTPKEKTYNVCTGISNDLFTLAEKVVSHSGKNLEIKILKEGLGREYSGNNKKLIREIGNFKFSGIDDSIKKLYNWYESIKEELNKNLL